MSFSSLSFVTLLPWVVAMYWVAPVRWRKAWLLLASAVFMVFNGLTHLLVLLVILAGAVTLLSVAQALPKKRAQILAIGITALLLAFLYYKYLGWFAGHFSFIAWKGPLQPIGISYYTFIILGFLLEIARGQGRLLPSQLPSMVMFFPILISGPIVRLKSWTAQMGSACKRNVMRNVTAGTYIFGIGCIKKVLIADPIGMTIAPVWESPGNFDGVSVAIALAGFYLQLYADFSGYTDMARGVARMFGFHLPINFRGPYLAATPTEFWSRWHMSLTLWIRDYVFNPLSLWVWRRVRSPKVAPLITFCLVVFLMAIVGLWHSASDNFLLFGALHGVLIGLWYAAVRTGRKMRGAQRLVSTVLFQLALLLSLVLFRAADFATAGNMLTGLGNQVGKYSISAALPGLLLVVIAVFTFQYFEVKSGFVGFGRSLVRIMTEVRLFPLFVAGVLFVLYMKGLTLEGVWISPGDPYFNKGQEQFIYFKF